MNLLTNLNLNKNELQNARIQNLASAPSNPVEGQIYHNTSDHKSYLWNNSAWVDITATPSGGTLTGVTASAPLASSGGTAPNITMNDSGVSAGTYPKVTVTAKGIVTGGASLVETDIPTLATTKITGFDTQVRTSRLDQMAAPTSAVSLNSQKITNLGTPTTGTDAVTKDYADNLRAGILIKDPVRVATTANITLSGTQTIDTIALNVGERVLVKDQTTAAQNGIYIVASGAWARSTDADNSPDGEVKAGLAVWVNEGTTNGDSRWVLTTNDSITLGTTALTFTKDFQAADIVAGTGLTKSGNTLNVVGTTNRITANADSIDIASTYVGQNTITTLGTVTTGTWSATTIALNKGGTGAITAAAARTNLGATGKYAANIGDGAATSIVVTHGLNTQDVSVTLRSTSSPYEIVYTDIQVTDVNTVTLLFATAPASGAYRCVVIG